jgi:hypothetical protein
MSLKLRSVRQDGCLPEERTLFRSVFVWCGITRHGTSIEYYHSRLRKAMETTIEFCLPSWKK